MRHRATYVPLALLAALAASFHSRARAQGQYDETLVRAREGLSLSRHDREVAAHLLGEWRASEEVAPGTGDPSLGRALEAMVAGRPLSSGEAGALRRYETACREDRYKAVERGYFPGAKQGPAGPASAGPASAPGGGRRDAVWWVVPTAGVAVVVLGAAWMIAARALRGR